MCKSLSNRCGLKKNSPEILIPLPLPLIEMLFLNVLCEVLVLVYICGDSVLLQGYNPVRDGHRKAANRS
jgi:hypothetical protein